MKDNLTKTKLIAGAYFRVSTGRQENEQTIESQIDEVTKRIEADGNILPAENKFIDDGWSGELLARPDLDRLRDAVKENKFEVLYVYDRGRLSRTFAHQELILEELIDRDIKFVSLHDIQADTPEARVMQAMQGVFHEYERIKIIERMRRGKLFKAKSGVIINGQALYGLKFIKTDPKQSLQCVINEDEANAVRLIWNWFAVERLSIDKIIKNLYDLGIKPKKRKSEFWTKGPIIRILQCDTYVTGKAYYGKSESCVAKHPIKDTKYKKVKKTSRRMRPREEWIPFDVPIIIRDYSLYEKNMKILDFNQKYAAKRKKYNYLLSGLIYCGCGSKRCGDGTSKYGHFYYRCEERIKSKPFERKCKSSGINAAILDAVVWHELKKKLFSYSNLKKYAEKWLKSITSFTSEDTLERQRLEEMIKKVDDEKTRYSKAYGIGTLDFEQFKTLMKDAKKRRISYQKQLNFLANKTAEINITIDVEELVAEVQQIIEKIDFSDNFRVIRDIIDKVIVSERSGVQVWAHLPLPAIITEKLGYEPQGRDSGTAKRREKHAV